MKVVFTNPEKFNLYDEPVPEFVESLRRAIKIECEILYPKTSSEEELIELAKDADIIVRGMGSSIQQKVLEAALMHHKKAIIHIFLCLVMLLVFNCHGLSGVFN